MNHTAFAFSSMANVATMLGRQVGELPPVAYEFTVSEDPARRILLCHAQAVNEGQSGMADADLRAIARQHPALVSEFSWLQWPHLRPAATP